MLNDQRTRNVEPVARHAPGQKTEISAELRLAVWRDFGKWRSLARAFDIEMWQ